MQPSACTDLHCTFNLAVKKVICSSMSLVWLGPVRLRIHWAGTGCRTTMRTTPSSMFWGACVPGEARARERIVFTIRISSPWVALREAAPKLRSSSLCNRFYGYVLHLCFLQRRLREHRVRKLTTALWRGSFRQSLLWKRLLRLLLV